MRIFYLITVLVALPVFYGCESKKTKGVGDVTKAQRIMDDANLLSSAQEDSIYAIISDVESNIGSQIAVLTVEALVGEPINDFSLRMANEMGLGRKGYDDGILITVASGDRQMRIEVGLGLEKIISDEVAAKILHEDMGPQFGKGDFFNGIYTAANKIGKLIKENKELVGQR